MPLKSDIQADMKASMKSGDKDRLKVVRMLLAAIKQLEVDKRVELDDPAVLAIVIKMVKQRRDSASQFRAGKRDDLADIEEAEITVLESYMPTQLADEEVDKLITASIDETGASGMSDMGKVMGVLKQRIEGRTDLGAVSAKVKARLA